MGGCTPCWTAQRSLWFRWSQFSHRSLGADEEDPGAGVEAEGLAGGGVEGQQAGGSGGAAGRDGDPLGRQPGGGSGGLGVGDGDEGVGQAGQEPVGDQGRFTAVEAAECRGRAFDVDGCAGTGAFEQAGGAFGFDDDDGGPFAPAVAGVGGGRGGEPAYSLSSAAWSAANMLWS